MQQICFRLATCPSATRSPRVLFGAVIGLLAMWLVVCPSIGYSQEAVQFGSYTMVRAQYSAPPLRVQRFGLAGLGRLAIVGAVGGENFEAMLSSKLDDAPINSIILGYDPDRKDGDRLWTQVNGMITYWPLPDWKLKPIASFADSNYTGAISLFGDGPDREKYYYIQYHDAFRDTLLGLRLLQADIVLMDPQELWDLPKIQGRQILGFGETAPNKQQSLDAAKRILTLFEDHPYQSWVLTDIGSGARLSKRGADWNLSSWPYYYFWLTTHKTTGATIFEIQDCVKTAEISELLLTQRCSHILSAGLEEDAFEVKNVDGLTSGLKNEWKLFEQLNPAVYYAVSQTSEYAALFRFVKQTNPSSWRNFLAATQKIQVNPDVRTPNQWEKTVDRLAQ